jgi:RNA-directed DNA polymerase
MPREKSKGQIPKDESTDAEHRDGAVRKSNEVPVMGTEQRDCIIQFYLAVNQKWEELLDKTKPFSISKQVVWEAYLRVKANKGAAGVDDISIAKFEEKLKDNLYKLWNRMSSGSYMPPAVKAVSIPKATGGERILGIPTVADRIAQMVATMYLEPLVEPLFHADSYGYRPCKSALEAVDTARQRCWRSDWVIDLDIKGFFDNLDYDLMMRAVRKHTDCPWVLLYIERWLKAPIQRPEGTLENRDKGTPQGGVISPLLANIFMHHAFDKWLRHNHPQVLFERYADDALVHCKTEQQAILMRRAIEKRLAQCKLELHPEKTQIVYCKDDDRQKDYLKESFDFLGETFRPRRAKNKHGKFFVSFLPAISNKAKSKIRKAIREWRIHLITWTSLENIAEKINPVVRGWYQYYGRFYKSEMYPVLRNVEHYLILWARKKYKRLARHGGKARRHLGSVCKRMPGLFEHWKLGLGSPTE